MTYIVEDEEKKECLCTIGRDVYQATPKESQCGGSSRNLKENCYVTSGCIVKGNEIIVSKRDLYSHVHCSIIHSSFGIETRIFQQGNGLKLTCVLFK